MNVNLLCSPAHLVYTLGAVGLNPKDSIRCVLQVDIMDAMSNFKRMESSTPDGSSGRDL